MLKRLPPIETIYEVSRESGDHCVTVGENMKQQLIALSEEDYRVFSSRLLPNTDHVLGVRLPILRKIAKRLAQSDWKEYLQTAGEDSTTGRYATAFVQDLNLPGTIRTGYGIFSSPLKSGQRGKKSNPGNETEAMKNCTEKNERKYFNMLTGEEKWKAALACDEAYDGRFYYGVKTTGIFCRPSCKFKSPKRENIEFFDTAEQARESGLRPCNAVGLIYWNFSLRKRTRKKLKRFMIFISLIIAA